MAPQGSEESALCLFGRPSAWRCAPLGRRPAPLVARHGRAGPCSADISLRKAPSAAFAACLSEPPRRRNTEALTDRNGPAFEKTRPALRPRRNRDHKQPESAPPAAGQGEVNLPYCKLWRLAKSCSILYDALQHPDTDVSPPLVVIGRGSSPRLFLPPLQIVYRMVSLGNRPTPVDVVISSTKQPE